jgi:hypothetical protein
MTVAPAATKPNNDEIKIALISYAIFHMPYFICHMKYGMTYFPVRPLPQERRPHAKLPDIVTTAFLSNIMSPPKNRRGRRPRRLIAAKRAGRAPALELGFNEIVRKLQLEKAG